MVGTGRRWPCLIVESAAGGLTPEQKSAVSETIVERTADFAQAFAEALAHDGPAIVHCITDPDIRTSRP